MKKLKKRKKILRIILGLPKSIYINFKCLPIKNAIKFPVLVSHRTKFHELKGKIIIESQIKTGMILIGIEGSATLTYQPTILELNGNIICKGPLNIGGASEIVTVNSSSYISFGKRVNFTGGVKIICRKSIKFGNDCIISWDTQFLDTDAHNIYYKNTLLNEDKEVNIGDKVWIGSRCSILKGCIIDSNNVIASGSNIYSRIEGQNQIITGNPIKILKRDITWVK